MAKITTVLFDFDGVITNTEPEYDIFFDDLGERYKVGIKNFAAEIKGTTMPDVMEKYFSSYSEEDKQKILRESREFELNMRYEYIPGVPLFIEYLKKHNYKIGLITSSQNFKMEIALKKMGLEGVFDTMVTADRITRGKPDPMCYLLGAKDLDSYPSECIVFEDAFAGIESGTKAGMKVIGVSSTIPAEKMQDKAYAVIPDFQNLAKVITFLN